MSSEGLFSVQSKVVVYSINDNLVVHALATEPLPCWQVGMSQQICTSMHVHTHTHTHTHTERELVVASQLEHPQLDKHNPPPEVLTTVYSNHYPIISFVFTVHNYLPQTKVSVTHQLITNYPPTSSDLPPK